MGQNEEFIENITKVSPSNNVTDETFNTPLAELQNNIKFLANFLTSFNVSSQYGNLLDYDDQGNRVSTNGGTFDNFENKNSWIAIENNIVVNDQKINSEIPLDVLMWNGLASTEQSDAKIKSWIEREFYIPPQLRGIELTFAIKGTGVSFLPSAEEAAAFNGGEIPYCDRSTVNGVYKVGVALCISNESPSGIGTSGTSGTSGTPTSGTSGTSGTSCAQDIGNKCFSRYEDVLVEVIGANVSEPFITTLGPWPNHKYFSYNPLWKPAYRTQVMTFRVAQSVSSIKIRIYRTRIDGAIALTNMFLGAIPAPYDGYKIENIDINELYNFKYGIVKFHSSTLLGHHLAQNKNNTLLSNILTKQQVLHVQQFNKVIDEYDWDQISGPRQIELDNNNTSTPKVSVFEFDPDFTRYLHFNMRVDGPDPGMSYLGFSYFVGENEFSDPITCSVTDSDCNPPFTDTFEGEIDLNSLPEFGQSGTIDSSGQPTVNCVKKEIQDNRYIYTYYFPTIDSGKIYRFIIGGYSLNNPTMMDPNRLEEYRNHWHFDYTDENNENLNTVCIMPPSNRIGYTFKNDSISKKWNLILPPMINDTSANDGVDERPCKNIKIDVYTKVVNPGDIGNPDISTYKKTDYIVPVPRFLTEGKLGYFEIYDTFFETLNENRGSIVYFVISRDGSHPADTFDGNFNLASVKLGVADPPDDLPPTGTDYTIIKVNC